MHHILGRGKKKFFIESEIKGRQRLDGSVLLGEKAAAVRTHKHTKGPGPGRKKERTKRKEKL